MPSAPCRLMLPVLILLTGLAATAARAAPVLTTTLSSEALIEPSDLAASLADGSGDRPLVLHVGARVLYARGHITGSEYVGMGSLDSGLEALRQRVERLPKSTAIVVYCGCCPWQHCPNVAAAYAELRRLGFTQVHALHIADDFGTNWTDAGFPTTTGD